MAAFLDTPRGTTALPFAPLEELVSDNLLTGPDDFCRCHLLLHDDVISTRRISWILYLPSANWQANPTWGGALELYPATTPSPPTDRSSSEADKPRTWRDEVGSDVIPGKTIHPKWGQFVFFEVQPGKSYHSVEEVVIGEGKERLSISGWFHKPVEGEEGYEGKDEGGDLSSLKQIVCLHESSLVTSIIVLVVEQE